MTSSAPEPIVIIGAGPSGLLLARYLQLHHIPCRIYEREPSANARGQGGSLDLHDDTGLLALRETGLIDEARTMMRAEGEAFKIVDAAGKVWMDENKYDRHGQLVLVDHAGGASRAAISDCHCQLREGYSTKTELIFHGRRTDLRNLLLRSLAPDTIIWDHTIKSCVALTPSLYRLTFASGETVTTPYLVGADGAFSLVRPLLHSCKPEYSGVTMYDLTVPPSSMSPALRTFVGCGSAMIMGDGKGVMPQMNSGGKCKVYAAFKVAESWADLNPLPTIGKREYIAGLFDGWPAQVQEIIMAAEEETIAQRRIWQSDPDLTWDSDLTGATVMGDSGMLMTPYAGEGVNQALASALDLGRTLVSLFTLPPTNANASLPPFPLSLLPIAPAPPETPRVAAPGPEKLVRALRRYEKRMLRRVRPYAIESKANLGICFGDNAAENFARYFKWMPLKFVVDTIAQAPSQLYWSIRESVIS